jgi:hypothetical protein
VRSVPGYGPDEQTIIDTAAHTLEAIGEGDQAEGVQAVVRGMQSELNQAIDWAGIARRHRERLQRERNQLTDFARWLVSLDDVTGPGAEERRTVNLNQIINRARAALAEPNES